jgi:hypothetical protein
MNCLFTERASRTLTRSSLRKLLILHKGDVLRLADAVGMSVSDVQTERQRLKLLHYKPPKALATHRPNCETVQCFYGGTYAIV